MTCHWLVYTVMEEVEEIGKERKWLITWGGFVEELKEVSYIAAPMVAVTVLQYLLQVVSVIIVGHLGQLALSGVALATSINNVTGFSLLVSLLILFLHCSTLSSKRSLCTLSNKCYPMCASG